MQQISKQTTDLAKLIQANSPKPLTWRQSVRRAVWLWECDRVIQEHLAELRREQAQQAE